MSRSCEISKSKAEEVSSCQECSSSPFFCTFATVQYILREFASFANCASWHVHMVACVFLISSCLCPQLPYYVVVVRVAKPAMSREKKKQKSAETRFLQHPTRMLSSQFDFPKTQSLVSLGRHVDRGAIQWACVLHQNVPRVQHLHEACPPL